MVSFMIESQEMDEVCVVCSSAVVHKSLNTTLSNRPFMLRELMIDRK